MAWSWSHTQEAYDNARTNLENLPLEDLQIILAEWKGVTIEDDNTFGGWLNLKKYDKELARLIKACEAGKLSAAEIAEEIWDKASNQATCDNGGWNAWMCPFGCGPHTVSFSRDTDPHNEDE